MKRNSLLSIVLAFVLIAPGIAFGQAKVGTTGVNFLKIGPSARGIALADALLPVADDASALWYNPGGLVNLKSRELILSHVTLPAAVNYDFVGVAQPLSGMGAAIGIQTFGLYTDAMTETTPERPFGTGRTFTASDFAAGISYSQRLTNKFSVGSTVKFVQENLAEAVARGWAVDVGTYYDTGWKSVRIAMIISNFGPDMQFESTPFPLPILFKFGTSADLWRSANNRLSMAVEGIHPNDNVEELHFGLEYAFKEFAFLRIGKKVNGLKRYSYDDFLTDKENKNPFTEYPILNEDGSVSMDGVSFGGGLKINGLGLTVDYAYANIGYLGSIHRFSLLYTFR